MKRAAINILLSVLTVALACPAALGQKYPERRHIRSGNKAYESQQFAEAERSYRQAQILDTTSVEAAFNLADAQYATEQFEAAENSLRQLSQNPRMNPEQAAKAYYNLGNAQFQQKKLQEALESYKQSLRLNPSDMEAKYNFAYTKKLLDQNKDQNDQNQDNKDNKQNNDRNQNGGNQNQNQPPQKDQDKQNQNNNPDDQNGQNDDKSQNGEQPEGDKPQPSEGQPDKKEVSPETEAMLQAVQRAEDKTRDKVNEKRAVVVGRSGKNW